MRVVGLTEKKNTDVITDVNGKKARVIGLVEAETPEVEPVNFDVPVDEDEETKAEAPEEAPEEEAPEAVEEAPKTPAKKGSKKSKEA